MNKWIVVGIIGVIILILTGSICYELTQKTPRVVLERNKAAIIQEMKEHVDLRHLLEELYATEEDFSIKLKNEKIVYENHGVPEELDSEKEQMIQRIFDELHCASISLHMRDGRKILKVWLGNVNVNKRDVYTHSIYYCTTRDKNSDLGDVFMKDWYYAAEYYPY